MADHKDAQTVLELQLRDMMKNSTKVAFQLASPANRRATAADFRGGNHNWDRFDAMVRNPVYSPLLHAHRYAIAPAGPGRFDVVLFSSDGAVVGAYAFGMSVQTEEDRHPSLAPYDLPKDSGYWRTDRKGHR